MRDVPQINAWVNRDSGQDADFTEFVSNPMNIALIEGEGGALFVWRQFRLPDPMIDLRLFRIPAFSAALAVNVLTIFVAVGYFLFVAQYLQLVLGLSPLEAGLYSVPSAIGFVVGSNVAPRILRYVRPGYVMAAGLTIAAAGLAILTQVDRLASQRVMTLQWRSRHSAACPP